MRGEEDLIAPDPADAGGVAGDLEPVVVLVEDAEFCAVVNGEGGVGVFKGPTADGNVTRGHDGDFGGAVVGPGNGNTGEEEECRDGGDGEIKSERTFEVGTPFAEGQEKEAEPESASGEEGPFVEGEFSEEALGVAGGEGRTLDLVASELEVSADVRVARSEPFGLEVSGDGFADLARFEICIAEVVVEGDGFLAGVKDVFVSGDGIGEFAAVVKIVGGVEGGGRSGGGRRERAG